MENNQTMKASEIIYFQPLGIKPQYCEVGIISETDKDYIWYLNEPCKIPISEVKIIPQENVVYNYKKKVYEIKES